MSCFTLFRSIYRLEDVVINEMKPEFIIYKRDIRLYLLIFIILFII